MVKNIIRFSLDNRFLVLVISALLCIAGVYTAGEMDTDVFPDLTAPTVAVMTDAHGMAPEEVEKLITFPIETAVNGATGIRRVRSSSAQGFSLVWVEFDWNMDVYNARQIVSEKLQAVASVLPKGCGTPTLMPQSSLMGEIFILALTSDSINAMDLRSIADWNIRPRLLSANGVAQVTVFSRHAKEYQVLADPGKMDYFGISFSDMIDILSQSNKNVSGGYMEFSGNRYTIRGMSRTADVREIGNRIIGRRNGKPVKLSDVATVTIGPAAIVGAGSYKQKDAVILMVSKQPNVNTLRLTEDLKKIIGDLQANLPEAVAIHTDIFKQEDFINSSINNVLDALYEGAFLVAVILFLFLMNVRVTIISLVSVPVSLLVTLLCLRTLGMGINTMVLGGMAIAIGSLVDDAIVDVENVYKRLRQNAALPKQKRKSTISVIYRASCEIRASIVNATLIIIVAFIPLFFLHGMEGRMLRPLGLTYIISLFVSLIVAMTLTNVLEVYLLGNTKRLRKHAKGSWLEQVLIAWYSRSLATVLQNRKTLLGTVAIILLASIAVSMQFGRSFLPPFNEGTLTINVSTLPGISFEESNKIGVDAESALLSIPEISVTERRTGRAELAEHSAGLNVSEIDAPYTLSDRKKETFLAHVRKNLNTIPGITYEVGQPISHRINHMLSGTKADIAIKIFGEDLETMYHIGKKIKQSVSGTEGIVDLVVEQQIAVPQVRIKPKENILSAYGITMDNFLQYIEAGFAGEKVASVLEGEQSIPLVVRFGDNSKTGIEAMKNCIVHSPNKGKIPLGYVSDIESSSGPNVINRENVKRKLVVSANVSGGDVRSAITQIRQIINEKIDLPEGFYIEYGGQFESEEKASSTLLVASLLSLLVIFMLLFHEFKDIVSTAIVMINLPLAIIGGVGALALSSGIVNIPALIGFITLFGIATRNGILLVSRYQTLLREGNDFRMAIIQGSADRLIPILMTALTAALALIPMAIAADAPGNEIQSPMAIVILGGLLSSTLLNIFVLPAVFWSKELYVRK